MRAIRIHETGGVEVLKYAQAEKPSPGPKDALVEVRAASLNHLDIWVRMGKPAPPAFPHTLGSDGAGIVVDFGREAAAAGATIKVGDEVVIDPGISCGTCEMCRAGEQSMCASFYLIGEKAPGTFAEFVVVPAKNCHPKPKHFTWAEAGAFGLVHVTAWRMLISRAHLRPGESVLINGIGGGVATAALSIARAVGAKTIVTSSSEAKLTRAKELGAMEGVNYRTAGKDLHDAIREANGGRLVDLVVDTVGAASWGSSLRALRKGGRLVTCGATTGGEPVADIHRIFWNQLTILGSTMGTPSEMGDVLRLAEMGVLKPVVDHIFPLERVPEAMTRLEQGGQLGKIVLSMKP